MDVTNVAGANAGLVARTARFALSVTVDFIGRPYLHVFYKKRLIPPGVTLLIKLI